MAGSLATDTTAHTQTLTTQTAQGAPQNACTASRTAYWARQFSRAIFLYMAAPEAALPESTT